MSIPNEYCSVLYLSSFCFVLLKMCVQRKVSHTTNAWESLSVVTRACENSTLTGDCTSDSHIDILDFFCRFVRSSWLFLWVCLVNFEQSLMNNNSQSHLPFHYLFKHLISTFKQICSVQFTKLLI